MNADTEVVNTRMGRRIEAALSACSTYATRRGVSSLPPMRMQVSIDRQIPTMAVPRMKAVAETMNPLSGQLSDPVRR
jgi:hypothetical protein